MRAVLYCRVSTKDQVDNLSLPTQEKQAREYCRREGWEVDKVFHEKGESAKTADRTELKKLLEYCRKNKGKIQAVVVYQLSRFAREKYDHFALRAMLASYGITLRSATEPIDDSPEGKLLEGVIASVVQFENDVKSDRTKEGMKQALENGSWPWQAPLGYLQPDMRHDPDVAALISKAFEMVADGSSRHVVLHMLNANGVRGKRGQKLTGQSFYTMLRNPIYMGRMVVPKWGIDRFGAFAPLVSPELFRRVQIAIGGKKATGRRYQPDNEDFPARHAVRCAVCGKPLTASWSRGRRGGKYGYYRCPNARCKAVNVRKEVLENGLLELVARLQPKDEYLKLAEHVVLDVWRGRQTDLADTRKMLEQRIDALKQKLARVEEAFLFERAITKEVYQDRTERLNQDLALAEMELHEARTEELDVQGVLDFARVLLIDADRLWHEASLTHKHRMLEVLFPKGLTYSEAEGFGTPETCFAFNWLPEDWQEIEGVASPTGVGVCSTRVRAPRTPVCGVILLAA